jgi:hypothetical protein
MNPAQVLRSAKVAAARPEPAHPGLGGIEALGDLRFMTIVGAHAWAALPASVRARFTKRVADGDSVVYAGEVIDAHMSWCGRLLANAARIIGAPLPLSSDIGVPAVVTVTEDVRGGGQVWTRQFSRRRNFPQVIHTAKRFAGPTGIEEYAGHGVSMALTVHVNGATLVFTSAGYYLQLGTRRFRLPRFLTPGVIRVKHAEVGDGRFIFTLEVTHPVFGEIIRQSAVFREVEA